VGKLGITFTKILANYFLFLFFRVGHFSPQKKFYFFRGSLRSLPKKTKTENIFSYSSTSSSLSSALHPPLAGDDLPVVFASSNRATGRRALARLYGVRKSLFVKVIPNLPTGGRPSRVARLLVETECHIAGGDVTGRLHIDFVAVAVFFVDIG
jgi:hypothetical protein